MSPSDTAEKGRTNPPLGAEGAPRHYHLLWDEELEALRPVLGLVMEHLSEVIQHWYRLYVLHFGDQRSLSEAEFRDIFYNALVAEHQGFARR